MPEPGGESHFEPEPESSEQLHQELSVFVDAFLNQDVVDLKALEVALKGPGSPIKKFPREDRQRVANALKQEIKEKIEKKELLQEVGKRGRLVGFGAKSDETEIARLKGVGLYRFIDGKGGVGGKGPEDSADQLLSSLVPDNKNKGCGLSNAFRLGQYPDDDLFEKKNVNAAVTICPLPNETEIGQYNKNYEDGENACRIFIYITDSADKPWYEHSDSYGTQEPRRGGRAAFNAILPESLARKVFAKIQQKPKFIFELLASLDPEMMEVLGPVEGKQNRMPNNIERILIVLEGRANAGFMRGRRGEPTAMDEECIHPFK